MLPTIEQIDAAREEASLCASSSRFAALRSDWPPDDMRSHIHSLACAVIYAKEAVTRNVVDCIPLGAASHDTSIPFPDKGIGGTWHELACEQAERLVWKALRVAYAGSPEKQWWRRPKTEDADRLREQLLLCSDEAIKDLTTAIKAMSHDCSRHTNNHIDQEWAAARACVERMQGTAQASDTPPAEVEPEQVKRVEAEPEAGDTIPDGPFAGDRFGHAGKQYEGLTGKPWLLLRELWNARHNTRGFDELAEPVWRDHAERPTADQVKGLQRRLGRFFQKHGLPFKVSVSEQSQTIRLISTDGTGVK